MQGMGQVAPDTGMKTRIAAVGWLPTALDLQAMTGIVAVMMAQYATRVVLAALDFDMMTRAGAADTPLADLLAVQTMVVVEHIDTACDQVVWVSFESRL